MVKGAKVDDELPQMAMDLLDNNGTIKITITH
jgi:hypothetical protein